MIQVCVILGSLRGVNEVCVPLEYYVAEIGSYLLTFRHNVWFQSSGR